MVQKVTPLFDRVLVQRDVVEKTEDGVVLPSAGFRNFDQVGMEFNTCTVIAAGDGCEDPRMRAGTRLVVGKYAFESGAGGAIGTNGARICVNMAEVASGKAKYPVYYWVIMEKDAIAVLEEEQKDA
jgi:co-chaperonin GroES (HSP10)